MCCSYLTYLATHLSSTAPGADDSCRLPFRLREWSHTHNLPYPTYPIFQLSWMTRRSTDYLPTLPIYPTRLDGKTIDWARLEPQPSDDPPRAFSYLNADKGVALKERLIQVCV